MDKAVIRNLIKEYQEFAFRVKVFPRAISLEEYGNYVFVGMRRAGKTYILYSHIQKLLSHGASLDSILFVNFEDERLLGLNAADLSVILDCYKEMYDCQPILFLDEIQIVEGWEKFARRLADTGYQVYVTGSNAKMLSSEIATTLGGRFLIYEVYPYNFSEYLSAQGIVLDRNMVYGESRFLLKKQFSDYFYFGGLPEVLRFDEKRQWLDSLFQKIFFGDVIARYDVRNVDALRMIVKKLAESVMQPISYTRLTHVVASADIKIGKTTVIDYIGYLQETWMLFPLSNIASKLAERETRRKFYFTDNGILNLFLFKPDTILLENIVALMLKRICGSNFYFYHKGVEVDFYVPDLKWAIQVAYSIADSATLQREIKAMLQLSTVMSVDRFTVITYDTEQSVVNGDVTIEIIPVWKWLLHTNVIE
jgi:predicted AAA+ superfamily ATPase